MLQVEAPGFQDGGILRSEAGPGKTEKQIPRRLKPARDDKRLDTALKRRTTRTRVFQQTAELRVLHLEG